MSVAHTLVASTSEPKSEMREEITTEFAMSTTGPKMTESVEMDLQVAYVDPSTGSTGMCKHSMITNNL